jgi:hypothetical protein
VSNKLTMADLSSNNGAFIPHQHWNAGHRLLLLKASEGTSYSWSNARLDAQAWHRLGGICGHYAFLRPGSGTEQADKFLTTIASYVGDCDFLVADAEVAGVTAREVAEFLDRVHDRRPKLRLMIYGTAYFLRETGIRPTHHAGLHVAAYPHIDFIPPGWATWVAHQFTQSGHAAGIGGACDLSYIRRELCQPVLRRGMSNFAVRDLKHGLHAAGLGRRTLNLASPKYGAGTARAVHKLKRQHQHTFQSHASGDVAGSKVWELVNHHLKY